MTHILFQVIECTLTNSQNLNVTHNNRGAIMSVSIVFLRSPISGKKKVAVDILKFCRNFVPRKLNDFGLNSNMT